VAFRTHISFFWAVLRFIGGLLPSTHFSSKLNHSPADPMEFFFLFPPFTILPPFSPDPSPFQASIPLAFFGPPSFAMAVPARFFLELAFLSGPLFFSPDFTREQPVCSFYSFGRYFCS